MTHKHDWRISASGLWCAVCWKFKRPVKFGALFDVYLGDRASIVEALAERRS